MPVTLYNLPGSPPCGFVRCIAKHIGVELKLRNLDLAKKEHLGEEYLKVNPFHKVPAIDDDGFVVYESIAIAYYLLRKYAPKSELYPDDIKARTRVDQALAALSGTIHPQAAIFYVDCIDHAKYPKLASYYERMKSELPYFEEIYGPTICHVKQHWASLQ
ncbi:glutathione S-transferase 1 isoform X8 [Dermacentor silvarum]|uniref:glutathione S-transferase 1 isoform X8 n=1 Tax=Dermacentor silvarum TaxID=543639 RepID=UPI002101D0F0|nr:glutathione S-transferase 1 isoform X8 [Dermacentor silvarum]